MGLIASAGAARIFFSGRNETKAKDVIAKLSAEYPKTEFVFIQCDQANLASVQEAAKKFLAQSDRLDVLMANAGVMALPANTTKDGYEAEFGTNHLGHALLIKLLLPIMEKTAAKPGSDVRIINLSSHAYQQAPKMGIDFETLKSDQASLGSFFPGNKWSRYGQSKLANLLYAKELAKHHPNITSVAVHPGFIKTDLFQNISFALRMQLEILVFFSQTWTPVEEGPYNQTWAATTVKSNLESGAYYTPIAVKTKPDTKHANDEKLAETLWEWTQKELAAY